MLSCRDVYDQITALPASRRSLEEYLRALLALVRAHREREPFSPDELVALLEKAYTATPTMELVCAWPHAEDGFPSWECRVVEQINELRSMNREGRLVDRARYFGVDMPSGSRWYNFTPESYLERGWIGNYGDDEEERIDPVTWRDFRRFLGYGQCYE
jgi:hypothetical protein